MYTLLRLALIGGIMALCTALSGPADAAGKADKWQVGTPIVTYWAGPDMTDAVAQQMADGGFNVVWCAEKGLDVVQRHGLRAMLQDGLLAPESLDDPARKAKLDELVERVKKHPALYSYYITDEPAASRFAALGRIVAYLRERDPAHLAYINLFPTYASNEQLGNKGDVTTAYREHVGQFVQTVKPDLVSYDHYHYYTGGGEGGQYFLNLRLIRRSALDAGLPFLNIVQASSWHESMRVPNGDELRWLVNTSLAYGAQGIAYYIYCWPAHKGGFANPDGSTTPLYDTAKVVNREFAAMAAELQPLRSLGVFHAGMLPEGTEALPAGAPFSLEPAVPAMEYKPPQPVQGMLLGTFGKPGRDGKPSHVMLVNLDHARGATTTLVGPGRLEVFDAATRKWTRSKGNRAEVKLLPGGGVLARVRR